jgi:diacylglycerol kinase family enzyme
VWFTHPLETFVVELRGGTDHEIMRAMASEALAVRISHFGGVLRSFAPGASLSRNDLRLVLFKTRSRLRYLQYVLRAALGRSGNVPGIELHDASMAICKAGWNDPPARRVYVEADGELIGTLPAELSVIRDALTLLAPKT